MMGRSAVLYAPGISKNTKRLADYIAKRTDSDIFNLKEFTLIDVSEYDKLIFGTAVLLGKPQKPLVEFLEKNKDNFNGKKLYLFLDGVGDDEKGEKLRDSIAESLGIHDAVSFSKKSEEMNDAGFPAAVDDYIARL